MNCRAINRNRGFSLVELMIVLAIVGILAGLVGPQFGPLMKRQSLLAESRRITSLIKVARSEARTRGSFVTISRAAADWSSSIQVYGPDELIRNDTTADRALIATAIAMGAAGWGDSVTAGWGEFISFNPRGWPRVPFNVAVCSSATDSTGGRLIQVNRVGKITEGPIDNADCT